MTVYGRLMLAVVGALAVMQATPALAQTPTPSPTPMEVSVVNVGGPVQWWMGLVMFGVGSFVGWALVMLAGRRG